VTLNDVPVPDGYKTPELMDDLETKLRIQKYELDDDLTEHPDLYHQVSKEYMFAKSRRDKLKLEKEQLEAELDASVRAGWREDDGKMTETGVKNKIMLMPSIKKLAAKYGDACLEADLWQALERAFDQRGYAIKDLVQLYASGYWTTDGAVRQAVANAHKNDPAFNRRNQSRDR